MNSEKTHKSDSFLYFLIFIHTMVAAGTYLIVKKSLAELPSMVFAFYRFVLAAIIVSLILYFRRKVFSQIGSHWKLLVFLSILAVPLNQGLFLIGLSYTQPTHAALLYATTPVWVYIIGALRKEETLSHIKSTGIGIALVGVIFFLTEKGITFEYEYLAGDFLILIAVWCWAGYTIFGRRLVQESGAVTTTSLALLFGSLLSIPFVLPFAINFDYSGVTPLSWIGVFYAAALTSVALYSVWNWTVARMEPSRAAIFMNLQPIVTAILSYLILGELLSAGTIISGLIIIGGVYLTQRD